MQISHRFIHVLASSGNGTRENTVNKVKCLKKTTKETKIHPNQSMVGPEE